MATEIIITNKVNDVLVTGSISKADETSALDLIKRGDAKLLSEVDEKEVQKLKKTGEAELKAVEAKKKKELENLKAQVKQLDEK